jgi:U3 small nucleolar RNA-associated protein 15
LPGKKIVSGSDDNTCKVWDIPSQEIICDFREHTDYVRCVVQSPTNPDLFLSGSYDKTIKLWDSKTSTSTLTMDHGYQIEKVLFLPGGGLVLSAGSNKIKIWDILNGGRLIYAFSPHQKAITSVVIDGSKSHLLTASLDHQVKVIDLATFKIVHSFKFPAPILSLGISVFFFNNILIRFIGG